MGVDRGQPVLGRVRVRQPYRVLRERGQIRQSRMCGIVWINPVKHGFVAEPWEWPHSSWHRDNR